MFPSIQRAVCRFADFSKANGSSFLTFLGSYNIFISPICGVCPPSSIIPNCLLTHILQIVIIDYFFIKRGNIHTPSLFTPARGTLYYYTKGWNLKALGCWVAAALFGIPGLVGAYHPSAVAKAATHMYQMGWVLCFTVAAAFYFGINVLLPARVVPDGYESDAKPFEGFADTEGYLEGDALVEFRGVEIHEGQEPVSGSASFSLEEKV